MINMMAMVNRMMAMVNRTMAMEYDDKNKMILIGMTVENCIR